MNLKKIFFYFILNIILASTISSVVLAYPDPNNVNRQTLGYISAVCLYEEANNTWIASYPCHGPYMVTLTIFDNNSVNVVIRPFNISEYRDYELAQLGNSKFLLPQGSNFTNPVEYTEYVKNKLATNSTFLGEWYQRYLNNTFIKTPIILNYVLDEKTNYVKGSNIGFFPLYSIREVDKGFVKDVKPVYMGSPLGLVFQTGFVQTNLGDHILYVVELRADNTGYVINVVNIDTMLMFKYKSHYLVKGENILLPVNDTTYVLLKNVLPYSSTKSFILSLPEADPFTKNIDFKVVLTVIGVGVVVGVVLWLRRR